MKKIWVMRAMTVAYLAPILVALGACMSGPGTESNKGGSGCNGNNQQISCGAGSHPVNSSGGSITQCAPNK